MSLKYKLALVVVATFAGFALTAFAVLQYLILPKFIELELQQAERDMERCAEAICARQDDLAVFASDWAAWDLTYQFINDEYEQYIEENVPPETFPDAKVSLMHFVNLDGKVAWSQYRDFISGELIQFRNYPAVETLVDHVLATGNPVEGILKTDSGPMLTAAHPILDNSRLGPSRGVLVIGRMINDTVLNSLIDQTRIPFTLQFVNLQAESPFPMGELPKPDLRTADREISGSLTLPCANPSNGLMIRASLSRSISAQGYLATRVALVMCLVGANATASILLLAINRVVLVPVHQLTEQIALIGKTPASTAVLIDSRQDEIGQLGQEFSRMLQRLTTARSELLAAIASHKKPIDSIDDFLEQMLRQCCVCTQLRSALIVHWANDERTHLKCLSCCIDAISNQVGEFPIAGTGLERLHRESNHFAANIKTSGLSFLNQSKWANEVGLVAAPLPSTTGAVEGWLVCVDSTDVTKDPGIAATVNVFATKVASEIELGRTSVALRKTSILFESVMAAMKEGVFLLDAERRFRLANSAWIQITGVPMTELIGHHVSEVLGDPIAKAIDEDSNHVCLTGENRIREIVLPKGDSRQVLQISQISHCDENQKMIGVIGVCRDVTELRDSQENGLRQLEQIAHANRISVMGEMSSGIAHEVNQPLEAITNTAYSVALTLEKYKSDLPNSVMSDLEFLSFQAERAGEIIRRMRSLSMKSDRSREHVDLQKTIHEVKSLIDSEFHKQHVHLVTQIQKNLPPVEGDQIQLQQVLLNLLRNSIEAFENSPLESRVVHLTATSDSTVVCITVADNGPGIACENESAVFEPFLTTKPEGMGMGLAICRSIIESHGGSLIAQTLQSGGASFSFRIPIAAHTDSGSYTDSSQVC